MSFERLAVRLVVEPEPPLFLDRVALVVEVVLRDLERPHAVGLEEQPEIELIGRQRFEVQRAILVGRPVHRAAVVEDQREVLAGADLLGPFEHHVFEQMREPGAALPLVTRADVVGDGDRVDGRGVVFRDDHAETVLELRVGERDARRGRRNASVMPPASIAKAAGATRRIQRGIGGPPSLSACADYREMCGRSGSVTPTDRFRTPGAGNAGPDAV